MTTPTPAFPASLWLRLLAGIYDLLPLLGLWLAAAATAVLVTGGALDTHTLTGKLLVQALVLGVTALYFVISWTRGGQTIGMRAWRLRVVRADGGPLDLARALLRFPVALLSLLLLGAGFWWSLLDQQQRTWHDRAAGTIVVRLEKAPRKAE